MASCVGCKFLYSRGYGYSNYTWENTTVNCAKDRNPHLADGEADEPCDWTREGATDNWPKTNASRCELFAEGPYVQLDVDGENGPADETDDREQIDAICAHSGRSERGFL
jgi:hypothetical protein